MSFQPSQFFVDFLVGHVAIVSREDAVFRYALSVLVANSPPFFGKRLRKAVFAATGFLPYAPFHSGNLGREVQGLAVFLELLCHPFELEEGFPAAP